MEVERLSIWITVLRGTVRFSFLSDFGLVSDRLYRSRSQIIYYSELFCGGDALGSADRAPVTKIVRYTSRRIFRDHKRVTDEDPARYLRRQIL